MFHADRNVRPCTILGYTLTTFPKKLNTDKRNTNREPTNPPLNCEQTNPPPNCEQKHFATFVKPKYKSKKDYIRKLSKEDIASIQEHYFLDPISFPLPDKKYQGKRFMRFNVKKNCKDVQFS